MFPLGCLPILLFLFLLLLLPIIFGQVIVGVFAETSARTSNRPTSPIGNHLWKPHQYSCETHWQKRGEVVSSLCSIWADGVFSSTAKRPKSNGCRG